MKLRTKRKSARGYFQRLHEYEHTGDCACGLCEAKKHSSTTKEPRAPRLPAAVPLDLFNADTPVIEFHANDCACGMCNAERVEYERKRERAMDDFAHWRATGGRRE